MRSRWRWVGISVKPLTLTLLLLLVGCGKPSSPPVAVPHGKLDVDDMIKLLPAQIEAALPNQEPGNYYFYALRLFRDGKKDDAVFWFYAGQLRARFYLKAHPELDPSGEPATYAALNATVGGKINEYAGGDIKDWIKAIDRTLQWDAAKTNGFTSKEKFAAAYEETRAGLKKLSEQIKAEADSIRAQRRKAGLEIRD